MSRRTPTTDPFELGAAGQTDDCCAGQIIGSYGFKITEKPSYLRAIGTLRAAAKVDG